MVAEGGARGRIDRLSFVSGGCWALGCKKGEGKKVDVCEGVRLLRGKVPRWMLRRRRFGLSAESLVCVVSVSVFARNGNLE